jgi:hypothetical protein
MSFSDAQVQQVWEKGSPTYDSANWRKDCCGAWIRRGARGNRSSDYGWEIDHIDPNGGDDIRNLQPLQWENNAAKANQLRWNCVKTFSGNQNVSV